MRAPCASVREQEEMGPEMDALVAQLMVGLSAPIWMGGELLGLGEGAMSAEAGQGLLVPSAP